ncbi:MAG: tRNA (guanosine(46)-N7)-methyltransferase TrmB, partial [Povalibacter sp.]
MTDENKPAESNPPEHRRSVRSFVLRMGRATAAQQRALTELWPVYGIDFGSSEIDLNASFGRTARRLIEIGFGNGEALIEFAKSHPEIDCIGIEVHRPGVGHLLLDAQALELKNVRVI